MYGPAWVGDMEMTPEMNWLRDIEREVCLDGYLVYLMQ